MAVATMTADQQSGFTLLEMAIVTALLGLLVSGGLFGLSIYREGIAQRATVENLDKIERALGLYALQHAGLPCPDTNADGLGEYTSDACTGDGGVDAAVMQGSVPYRDLGLQRDDALDGWKRLVSYAVTAGFGTTPDGVEGGAGTMPDAPDYRMNCSGGSMDYSSVAESGTIAPLADPDGGNWPSPAPPQPAYALISHGQNGFGAFMISGVRYVPDGGNVDEDHNAQVGARGANGNRAAEEIAVGALSTGFDDVVRTRTPAQILYDFGCNNDVSS